MSLRWGIMATGGIARRFAEGLRYSRTGTLVAIGSRSQESADRFAAEYGGRPHSSYEALLADAEVDAVYIATPHHLHKENTIAAARAGKHILCEKPFTLNAPDAEEALAAVDKAGVAFMEAFMYRCHPQTRAIQKMLAEGKIGEARMVAVEFGFRAGRDWDNFRTVGALGGGALMDVGCYCVSFCRMVAGQDPSELAYSANIGAKGYDEEGVGTLHFPSGLTAHFGTAIHLNLENQVVIHGTEGRLRVTSPWFCNGELLVTRGEETETVPAMEGDLYAYEADAFDAVVRGEAPAMPIEETLSNMRTLDALRRSAGLRFGGEA